MTSNYESASLQKGKCLLQTHISTRACAQARGHVGHLSPKAT